MKRNKLALIIAAWFMLLASSCTHDEVYSGFCSFPKAVWEKDNPALFNVDINDASARYSLTFEIRNNDEYPFRNLWLFIDVFTPSGDILKDTVDIELADIYGKWYGTGLSLYTYSFPYQSTFQYPDTGRYVYTIRQGMREEALLGISDIGLTVVLEE